MFECDIWIVIWEEQISDISELEQDTLMGLLWSEVLDYSLWSPKKLTDKMFVFS